MRSPGPKGHVPKGSGAGLVTGFTGVDDSYNEPENPEVRIDTTQIFPEEAAQEILLFLGQKGYI